MIDNAIELIAIVHVLFRLFSMLKMIIHRTVSTTSDDYMKMVANTCLLCEIQIIAFTTRRPTGLYV
jgi:uncharacterized membrane protein